MIRGLALGLLGVATSFALALALPSPVVAPPPAQEVVRAPQTLSFAAPISPRYDIPALDNLPEPGRSAARVAAETTRAPCEPCWTAELSVARCVALSVCPNLHPLLQRARRGALAGLDVRALTASISYGDVWVPEAAGAPQGPVSVELWLDPRDPFSADALAVAERIAALSGQPQVTVYLFQSESTSPRRRGKPAREAALPQPSPDIQLEPDRGARTHEAATARGVRSSPTWFVGGYRLRGMVSQDQLALVLRRELDDRAAAR